MLQYIVQEIMNSYINDVMEVQKFNEIARREIRVTNAIPCELKKYPPP